MRDSNVETLQRLLMGEISAVETYEQVIEKTADRGHANRLEAIAREHHDALDLLSGRILALGQTPETSSGSWGVWAKSVTGTSKAFGVRVAMKALKEGEEHGIKEYENALDTDDLDPETREVINKTLLPRQHAHIETLDELMRSAA